MCVEIVDAILAGSFAVWQSKTLSLLCVEQKRQNPIKVSGNNRNGPPTGSPVVFGRCTRFSSQAYPSRMLPGRALCSRRAE